MQGCRICLKHSAHAHLASSMVAPQHACFAHIASLPEKHNMHTATYTLHVSAALAWYTRSCNALANLPSRNGPLTRRYAHQSLQQLGRMQSSPTIITMLACNAGEDLQSAASAPADNDCWLATRITYSSYHVDAPKNQPSISVPNYAASRAVSVSAQKVDIGLWNPDNF
jgi:hypothetical protein